VSEARPSAETASSLRSNEEKRALCVAFLIVLLAFFWAIAGCKKSEPGRLTPARIHSITREFAEAAHSAAPAGTQIRIGLQASEKSQETIDHLDITVLEAGPDSAARSDIAKIQQALGAVATRHGLTEEPSESREGILLFYLKGGARTHGVRNWPLFWMTWEATAPQRRRFLSCRTRLRSLCYRITSTRRRLPTRRCAAATK